MREPTNEEQRLMRIGGFETLEEYLEWLNSPTDPDVLAKLEEPDLEEEVIEELDLYGVQAMQQQEEEEAEAEDAREEALEEAERQARLAAQAQSQ